MSIDRAVDSAVLDAGLTAIADAIREKGGTSDPIAFDAMADAIAAIQAGGGGRAFASGSFTLSSNTIGYTITHDLGEIPYFVIVFCNNITSFMGSPSYAIFSLFGFSQSTGGNNNFGIHGSTLGAFTDLITTTDRKKPLYGATSTTIKVRSSSYTLVAGKEYHWMAIGA